MHWSYIGIPVKIGWKERKISLQPQSCRLLKIFAPFDTPVKLPYVLGAEDKLAFRLDPYNLGAPVKWYRELSNMAEITMEKIRKLSNNSLNDNSLPHDLEDECYKVALYDMSSNNADGQKEQKSLYMSMFERTKGYITNRADLFLMLHNMRRSKIQRSPTGCCCFYKIRTALSTHTLETGKCGRK